MWWQVQYLTRLTYGALVHPTTTETIPRRNEAIRYAPAHARSTCSGAVRTGTTDVKVAAGVVCSLITGLSHPGGVPITWERCRSKAACPWLLMLMSATQIQVVLQQQTMLLQK
jgi:hypothetical protein